jgi:diacylglycerol kinase (ATP)
MMSRTAVTSYAVILNPSSGTMGELDEVTAMIRELLPGAEIMVGSESGDAERAAREARERGVQVLIAAGGDGTLNEVLNGALATAEPVTLGLLPLGTGNDFARALGLPTDLREALEVVRTGKRRAWDGGRVTTGKQQRFMINVSAGGFAGVVNDKLTPELKATWGPLAYFRGMIEALGEMEPYSALVTLDDGAAETLSVLNIVVANATHVAKGIPIAPAADPSDGLLDLVAIRAVPLAKLALLAPRVLAAAHLDHEDVLHLRARHMKITSTPPMTFNTDGEVLGESPVTFEVVPGAISFLVPEPAPTAT